ncbi:MAG: Pvc16 family protein [Caldilineales bacterium]
MATYRAISATCQAIVRLLQQSWRPELFDDAPLQFAVYSTQDFADPMDAGVSLFLYRANINGAQRTPPARIDSNGQRRRPQLPLDLHLLLTPWAKAASLEHEILGWTMRTLEDWPILPAGILNSQVPNTFAAEETVEIVRNDVAIEELVRIWDVLPHDYHVSASYIARVVRIDSDVDLQAGSPVLTRQLDYGVVEE